MQLEYCWMKNLLRSLRSAGAMLACSALQCSGKHGSRSDDDVRARHMGQVPTLLFINFFFLS